MTANGHCPNLGTEGPMKLLGLFIGKIQINKSISLLSKEDFE